MARPIALTGLHDGRLGGAGQPGPPPDLPPRPGEGGPRRLRPRRAAGLRPQQHPLHHEHPHRRVGPRQDDALRAPDAWRRAAPLGLRLGRQAPSPVLPVAAAREHPRRDDRAARRGGAGGRPLQPAPPARSRESCAEGVADMPLGVDIVEPPMLAALARRGDRRSRRPADHARRARGQVDRRDHAAQHGLRHGRRRLPDDLPRSSSRASARTSWSRRPRSCSSTWAPTTSRPSTPSRASAAAPTPTSSRDRLIRPGDQAFFDIIQSFVGYRTCYYRTFCVGRATDAQRDAYKRAREWIDASIELMRPGVDAPTRSRGLAEGRPSSASRARWSASGSSSATAWAWPPRAADHQPAQLARPSGRAARRAWSSPSRRTARRRRHLGGPDRGGGRRHGRRAAGHHALPVGRAVRGERRTERHGDDARCDPG